MFCPSQGRERQIQLPIPPTGEAVGPGGLQGLETRRELPVERLELRRLHLTQAPVALCGPLSSSLTSACGDYGGICGV